MTKNRIFSLLVLIVTVTALISCNNDDSFFTGANAELTFSQDTVFFDTVFTAASPRIPMSVNKQFVVRNPHNKRVKSSLKLMSPKSVFRINVDGEVGPIVSDIEIGPNDSIFVFVELSVDPNNEPESLPLIVRDSIEVETNGSIDYVQLIAWGQDAHYMFRDTVCNVVLSDKMKPYVVYGYLYVPENCTLTIEEGVRMHFAPQSWLYVEGTLIINGTNEERVLFQGDRLQPEYEEEAGQWGGIWLDYLSSGNRINYAEIKNGTVGVYCDSSDIQSNPNLLPKVVVRNTEVRNMSFDGLSGKSVYLQARNSVFSNCGRYTFLGLWGGRYDLKHCNFTTYGFDFSRREPTFVLNNAKINEFFQIERVYDIKYDVQNCIIDGALEEEVSFGLFRSAPVRFEVNDTLFQNNLVRTEWEFGGIHTDNVTSVSPSFIDIRNHDYHIESNSGAINIGNTAVGLARDFENRLRDAKPDAGAFEYLP